MALTRVHICAGSSEPCLLNNVIRAKMSSASSNVLEEFS